MSDLTSTELMLRAELSHAVRRDHHRRGRRRRRVRAGVTGVAAVMAVCGGAVAAGEALGLSAGSDQGRASEAITTTATARTTGLPVVSTGLAYRGSAMTTATDVTGNVSPGAVG